MSIHCISLFQIISVCLILISPCVYIHLSMLNFILLNLLYLPNFESLRLTITLIHFQLISLIIGIHKSIHFLIENWSLCI